MNGVCTREVRGHMRRPCVAWTNETGGSVHGKKAGNRTTIDGGHIDLDRGELSEGDPAVSLSALPAQPCTLPKAILLSQLAGQTTITKISFLSLPTLSRRAVLFFSGVEENRKQVARHHDLTSRMRELNRLISCVPKTLKLGLAIFPAKRKKRPQETTNKKPKEDTARYENQGQLECACVRNSNSKTWCCQPSYHILHFDGRLSQRSRGPRSKSKLHRESTRTAEALSPSPSTRGGGHASGILVLIFAIGWYGVVVVGCCWQWLSPARLE